MKANIRSLAFLTFYLLTGLQSFSQAKLTGSASFTAVGGSRYTNVNWEIYYRFVKEDTRVNIVFYNPKITVSPTSLYATSSRNYSLADLGISVWPQTKQPPYNMDVEITGTYGGGTFTASSDCGGDNNCRVAFFTTSSSNYNLSLATFKVTSVTRMHYNGGGDAEVERMIVAKQSNASANNSRVQNGSNSTSNGPAANSGYSSSDKAAAVTTGASAPPSYIISSVQAPPASDNFTRAVQATGQILNAAAPLIQDWADARNAKRAAELAEYNQNKADIASSNAAFADYVKSINIKIATEEGTKLYFTNGILPILKAPSTPWATILKSDTYTDVFGKDIEYITKNYKPQYSSRSSTKQRLFEGDVHIENEPSYMFEFYAASPESWYKYSFHTMKNDNMLQFIFDKNNIVIGIRLNLNIDVNYGGRPVQEYYNEFISRLGKDYVMMGGDEFLFKDKFITFISNKYNTRQAFIVMYDLNYIKNAVFYTYPYNHPTYSRKDDTRKYPPFGIYFDFDNDNEIKNIPVVKAAISRNKSAEGKNYLKLNGQFDKGVVISGLNEDGLGYKAGLRENDIIVKAEGIEIRSPYVYQLIAHAGVLNGQMLITFMRNSKEYELLLQVK